MSRPLFRSAHVLEVRSCLFSVVVVVFRRLRRDLMSIGRVNRNEKRGGKQEKVVQSLLLGLFRVSWRPISATKGHDS